MEQSKEIKQNWAGGENFDNSLIVVFDHYFKRFISGRLGARPYLHQTLTFP